MPDDRKPAEGPSPDRAPVTRFLFEALTIVFSILVALALDAGAEQWRERQDEREYMGLLRAEFQESFEDLEADRAARERIHQRARTLLAWAEGSVPPGDISGAFPEVTIDLAEIPEPLPLEVAAQWIGSIRDFRYYTPVQIVLEDLVSSGSLGVIESAELRRLILRLRQEEERIAVVDERERDFAAEQIEPWLARNLPLDEIEIGTADPGDVERRLRAMARDPEFQSLVEIRLSRTETAYRFSGGLYNILRALVEELDRELGVGDR